MTEPLSDRLFLALGDTAALAVTRCLLGQSRSQAELASELGLAQSTISRAVRVLRDVGIVSAVDRGRAATLGVDAKDEAIALLLASDRLAERIHDLQATAQQDRSRTTRQLAIRPTPTADIENQAGS